MKKNAVNMNNEIEEKILKPFNGMAMLVILILVLLASIAVMIFGIAQELVVPIVAAVIVFCLVCILFAGLKVINPNEALVLTLFGEYYGTIKSHGFFFVNPFATGRNPVAEKQGAPEGLLEEFNDSNKRVPNQRRLP